MIFTLNGIMSSFKKFHSSKKNYLKLFLKRKNDHDSDCYCYKRKLHIIIIICNVFKKKFNFLCFTFSYVNWRKTVPKLGPLTVFKPVTFPILIRYGSRLFLRLTKTVMVRYGIKRYDTDTVTHSVSLIYPLIVIYLRDK